MLSITVVQMQTAELMAAERILDTINQINA